MTYVLEDIAHNLKAARLAKGLSQRALSAKTGLTQSHISKIENASVDLQLSNLIELARALDLELTLVPAKAVPAVKGITHAPESSPNARGSVKAHERGPAPMPLTFPLGETMKGFQLGKTVTQLWPVLTRPAYSLDEDDRDE